MADAKISELVDGSTDLAISDLLVFVDLSAGTSGTKRALVSSLTQALGWVNVKTHNATGDGITDDTAEIHAARDAAGINGTVYLPSGTYLVSAGGGDQGALQLTVSGQHWIVSAGATIKLSNSQSNQVQVIRVSGGGGVHIYGPGTIDGNRTGQSQTTDMHGVQIRANNCVVHGLHVTGCNSAGIEVIDSDNCRILYNYIDNCTTNGIFVRRASEQTLVHGNTIRSCDNDPIIAHAQLAGSAPHRTIISNNHVEPNNSSAFGIECGAFSGDRPTNVQIIGNSVRFSAVCQGGISIDNSDNCIVQHNTIDDNGFEGTIGGIELAGASRTVVQGNTLITPNTGPSISFDRVSYCVAEGNIVNGWVAETNGAGIKIHSSQASASAQYNIVKGNVVIASSASAVDGIYLMSNAGTALIDQNIIEGNILVGAGVSSSRGINLTRFTATGNTCQDNQIRNNHFINWPTGIFVTGSSTERNRMDGNIFETVTTRYSVAAGSGPIVLKDDAFSPSALSSGNTNNYAAQVFGTLRISADAAGSTITGVAGGTVPADKLRIINISANTLTISHEDVNSDAQNRFTSPTASSVALGQNDCCDAEYDDVSQRWRIVNVLT